MTADDIFDNINHLVDEFYDKGDWQFRQQFDDFLLSIDEIDERAFVFGLCQSCLELKKNHLLLG